MFLELHVPVNARGTSNAACIWSVTLLQANVWQEPSPAAAVPAGSPLPPHLLLLPENLLSDPENALQLAIRLGGNHQHQLAAHKAALILK